MIRAALARHTITLLAVAAVAASAAALVQTSRLHAERAAHANTRADHAAEQAQRAMAAVRALDAAAAETQRLTDRHHAALAQQTRRAQAHRADHDRAVFELDRLRHAIATAPGHCAMPGDPATPGADRADPARELLGACAEQLADLARAADGHARDAVMLWYAWPSKPDER